MLRRVAKSAMVLFPKASKQLLVNVCRPVYFFAAKNETNTNLQANVQ